MRCINLNWKTLNPAVKRKVKDLEKELQKKAYVLWEGVNPKGERYMFVRLGKKSDPDHTVATVAVYTTYVSGYWNAIGF